jgi:molybdopterin converting factor subunit 1
MATIKLCFFASLGEKLGLREEIYTFDGPLTLSQLKHQLHQRSQNWQVINDRSILCAVNFEMVNSNIELKAGDEIAFFPPVTGG